MRVLGWLAAGGAALALGACAQEGAERAFTGYVEADLAYIAAPDTGWIETMQVDEGDEVAPGDVLFALDVERQQAVLEEAQSRLEQAQARLRDVQVGARPEEIAVMEAELAEAEASLNLAEVEARRAAELVRREIAAQASLDQAAAARDSAAARVAALRESIAVARLGGRADVIAAAEAERRAARAAVAQAQWALSEREVVSRVAGLVEEVFVRRGEYVGATQPVLAILEPERLEVRFFVPEGELADVTLGGAVEVRCDGCGAPVAAEVSYIARAAEFTPPVIFSENAREALVFLVKARPEPGSGLRPGQPVDVALAR